jgi:hypothetical protein
VVVVVIGGGGGCCCCCCCCCCCWWWWYFIGFMKVHYQLFTETVRLHMKPFFQVGYVGGSRLSNFGESPT